MKIGLPRALLYHQYGVLWKTFFTSLGCGVVISDETNGGIFEQGVRDAVSECCLPAKAYLGHVSSLIGRCDYILSPYATRSTGGKATCIRFWGMSDVIRHTYPQVKLLEYVISEDNEKIQYRSFCQIGKELGQSMTLIRSAYESALAAQSLHNHKLCKIQSDVLLADGLKVMVAGRPYVLHDPYIGGAVVRMLSEMGVIPIFSDRFDHRLSVSRAKDISPRLCWRANQETVGAIVAHKEKVEGVLLLTVFPCASDALVNDITLRAINDIPTALILLDGLQAEAGLQTRIESFIDILRERREDREARTTSYFISAHG